MFQKSKKQNDYEKVICIYSFIGKEELTEKVMVK